MSKESYFLHKTAEVEKGATIGENTSIWRFSSIRKGASIGSFCNIGQSVYIDEDVRIGNYVKIQNNVSVYYGVSLEDYVFCGPSMVFTNVLVPRSKYPKEKKEYNKTLVKEGATIGANAVIVCGNVIGKHSLIGAGSVITKDVKDYALVVGNPARQVGWVCECGKKIIEDKKTKSLECKDCFLSYIETENGLVLK